MKRAADRPRAMRLVVGLAPAVPGAHARLAMAASDRARALGLASVRFERSKHSLSHSYYLMMRDARGRDWKIRISEHYCPRRTEVPHVDFISRDGIAGRDTLLEIVDRIAAGTVAWFESKGTARPDAMKRRRKR